MIEQPKRSITRFFVPMVDVMILLFSIFLLMPVLQHGGEANEGRQTELTLEELLKEHQQLKKEVTTLTNELAEREEYKHTKEELLALQREKINTLKSRLDIRVLEIDPNNGKLVYYDRKKQPPDKIVINNEFEARKLIRRHKQEADNLELYYLLLFPRVDSAFPEERQFQRYQEWLKENAYGVDRPPVNQNPES